jgi:cytochrome c
MVKQIINPLRWTAASLAIATSSFADLTYENCSNITTANFNVVEVTKGGRHVVEMEITPDGNIFFVTLGTGLNVFDRATGEVYALSTTLRNLFGVALDPKFSENNWIYLYHTSRSQKLSELFRVTYDPVSHKVSNAKTLLSWEILNDADHDGGSMKFDFDGNLWLTTGDNNLWQDMYGAVNETKENYNSLRTAANSNHLSGKVLRLTPIGFLDGVTPTPGAGSTYNIPSGNFAEYYKTQMNWTAQDLAKVRPEIFAMGFRNPFSLNIDHNTGWIIEGDLGPQAARASTDKGPVGGDELNVFKKPGFYGWPMFTGQNEPYNQYDYAANKVGKWFDPLAPVNNSPLNTGIQTLPPPIPSLLFLGKNNDLNYYQAGAVVKKSGDFFNPNNGTQQSLISGPIVKYNKTSTVSYKLPPHLHQRWIVSDHFYGGVYAIQVDATRDNVLAIDPIVENNSIKNTMDLELGADGALYIAAQSGVISRIQFLGTCDGSNLSVGSNGAGRGKPGRYIGLPKLVPEWINGTRQKSFRVFDLQGQSKGIFSIEDLKSSNHSLSQSELLIFEGVVGK